MNHVNSQVIKINYFFNVKNIYVNLNLLDEIGLPFYGIVNHVGFTNPPGGEKNSNLHVLNDHTYCC